MYVFGGVGSITAVLAGMQLPSVLLYIGFVSVITAIFADRGRAVDQQADDNGAIETDHPILSYCLPTGMVFLFVVIILRFVYPYIATQAYFLYFSSFWQVVAWVITVSAALFATGRITDYLHGQRFARVKTGILLIGALAIVLVATYAFFIDIDIFHRVGRQGDHVGHEHPLTGECKRFHELNLPPWYWQENIEHCGMINQDVSQECYALSTQINRNYCNRHIETAGAEPDCTNVSKPGLIPPETHNSTATDAGCNWREDPAGTLDDTLTDGEPIITIDEHEINCLNEGIIEPTCPA